MVLVDTNLEELLAYHELNWCTGACVYEDICHIFELTSPASKGLQGHNVKVKEILSNEWAEEHKDHCRAGNGKRVGMGFKLLLWLGFLG